MKTKRVFQINIILPILLVIGIFFAYGADAWKIWNIPRIQPPFIDARIITSGAESSRLGFHPEIENPRDPYNRLFNLPVIWEIFFLTGMNQTQTNILAGFLIASFMFGLISFAGHLTRTSALVVVVCAFTPPILLAVERGNVDLFVFLICALSIIWIEKNLFISIFFLWIAGILKIYPIFGLVYLMYLGKRPFIKYSSYFILAFGFYGLLTLENFHRVFSNTEVGFDLSYGLGVLPYYVEITTGKYENTVIFSILSVSLAILIAVLSIYWFAKTSKSLTEDDLYELTAFRLGAGIYLGTFLLGNNWDYRLIFLLFTLPQLVEWISESMMAKITLTAIVVSLSYLWLVMLIPYAYYLDEFANWLVYVGLFYLLAASFPDWLRNDLQKVFGRNRVNNV